jgi:hypothetical protein
MLKLISEDPKEKLLIELNKILKSERKRKIFDGIIENIESFNSFKNTKELPAISSFFEKGKVDHSYLWLLSRREDESYYCGTWFDKIGKTTGIQFRAKQYKLSKVAKEVLKNAKTKSKGD